MASDSITIFLDTAARMTGITAVVDGLSQVKASASAGAASLEGFVGKVVALAASTLGFVGVVKMTKDAIDNADMLGRTAQKAGMAVEDFATLSAAAFTASKVTNEQLVIGLKALANWMGRTGQAGQDLNEVFLKQADIVSKMADGDEKTRLIRARFGRSGLEIIPFLNLSSAGIEHERQMVESLGMAMGSEFPKQARAFNQNLGYIQLAIKGAFTGLSQALMPELLSATDSIISWLTTNMKPVIGTIKDVVHVAVSAYQDGGILQLITDVFEVGIDKGFHSGMAIAKTIIESTLMTVDFLMFSARIGKVLADSLISAVKAPVDFIVAGMGLVGPAMMNSIIKAFYAGGDKVFELELEYIVNPIIKMIDKIPGMAGKFAPLTQSDFKPLEVPQVQTVKFTDLYTEAAKTSAAAAKNISAFLQKNIDDTNALLRTGAAESKATVAGTENKSAAEIRLAAAFEREKQARLALEAIPKEKPERVQEGPSVDRVTEQQKLIDLQIESLNLEKQRLEVRGMVLDGQNRTVGSLQDEGEKIKAINADILNHVKEKQRLESTISEMLPEQDQKTRELKIQKELLAVEKERIAIKDKLNDFSFMTRVTNNLQDMADKFANLGVAMADTFTNGVKGAIDVVSKGIWQVIDGTATWGNLFRQVGRQVISSLIEVAIQHFVVDNIVRAIKTAYLGFHIATEQTAVAASAVARAEEVGYHFTAETAMTGASTAGSASRGAIKLGETIWHGILTAAKTAAHIAGEVAMTTATLIQAAIRMPVTILEAGKDLIVAAFKAASAVADIPYVGPILAVAAMAAIIGAGVKYMGGFEEGGVVRGPQQVIRINENGTESVLNARATAMLGESRINAMNAGMFDLESRAAATMIMPAQSRPMAAPGSDGPSGNQSKGSQLNVVLVDSRSTQAYRDFMDSSAGRAMVLDIVKNNKMAAGIK